MKLVEWRSWTAKRIAPNANRIDGQRLRVIPVVVLNCGTAAVLTGEFFRRSQFAALDRGRNCGSGFRLRNVSTNRARRTSAAFRAFVFVRPALDSARWARDALFAFRGKRPFSVNDGYRDRPVSLCSGATVNIPAIFSRSPDLIAVHAACVSGGQSSGRKSWSVTDPPDASTYIQQLAGAGVLSSRSSSTR
ncbi:MAG: hypothetical protein RB191_11480 [Terriglobia bacterium]|nr:hypothetical protein [Terriglobia bacterium]